MRKLADNQATFELVFIMSILSKTSNRLLIFAKAPVPGNVKTRLAASLGAQAACEAYETLVRYLVRQLRGLSNVTVLITPDEAVSTAEVWKQPGWQILPQGEGSLGERLERNIARAFQDGAVNVLAIGSDCPYVSASEIRAAFRQLGGCDVLVGPSTDGGYWLIGLKQPRPELFRDMAWGTDQVLGETLRRCKSAGCSIGLMSILEDVDELPAWQRFLSHTGAAMEND